MWEHQKSEQDGSTVEQYGETEGWHSEKELQCPVAAQCEEGIEASSKDKPDRLGGKRLVVLAAE